MYKSSHQKEPWQIVAARYCVENSERGFDTDNLKKYIQSIYSVSDAHINQFVEEELQMPPGSKFSRNARGGSWIPPLGLVSMVTDYDELKEARNNAKHAFILSVIAIIISVITLWVNAKQTNYTELQSRADRILQVRKIQSAIESCEQNPESQESGLFEVDSGKPASCTQVLQFYKSDISIWDRIKNKF